jgi:adenosylcobinamide kinase/adenosylcobinamide-phosphate guanylyltransferase
LLSRSAERMIVVITGGVRSGKSACAAARAAAAGGTVTYIATAWLDPSDAEFVERVARHRRDRPATWRSIEPSPSELPALLAALGPNDVAIVDSVGTWVSTILLEFEQLADRDPVAALDALEARLAGLPDACAQSAATVFLVTEEVGMGIVPVSATGRIFRDALGRLNAALAARADRVVLMVAGIPLAVKG